MFVLTSCPVAKNSFGFFPQLISGGSAAGLQCSKENGVSSEPRIFFFMGIPCDKRKKSFMCVDPFEIIAVSLNQC